MLLGHVLVLGRIVGFSIVECVNGIVTILGCFRFNRDAIGICFFGGALLVFGTSEDVDSHIIHLLCSIPCIKFS